MNNKKILQMAQQESQDEGKLSKWRNMSIVHYIMLLLAWLFIFTIRLLKNESIDDLFLCYYFWLWDMKYICSKRRGR